MNPQLLKFMFENHTIDGSHISIGDNEEILKETVKRIDEHQSADVDVMVNQLIESDLIEKIARALVMGDDLEIVCVLMDLEKLAKANLEELIFDLLRAA